MVKVDTEEKAKARAEYKHPGITMLRERVSESIKKGICEWCGLRLKHEEGMEEHLKVHVLIGTNILLMQGLRMQAEKGRDI